MTGTVDDRSLVAAEQPHEAWLRRQFGLSDHASVEAASAYADGIDGPALRITPVHLHVGLDHLLLTDPGTLELGIDEARQLAESVAPVFAEQGLVLQAAAPLRWYLHGGALPGLVLRSWRMAAGRNIDVYSPQGEPARLWRKLVTEVQMSWHEHPVNLQREASGQAAINSLWLDGRMGEPQRAPFALVATDDPAVLGLAQASGSMRGSPAVVGLNELRTQIARQPRAASAGTLVMLEFWRQKPDHDGFAHAWQAFRAWIDALLTGAGAAGGFDAVRLVLTGEARLVEVDWRRADRWRLWQRFDLNASLERPAS